MVSTRDDGHCGIGAYTGALRRSMDEPDVVDVPLELRSLNVLHYAKAAVSVGSSDVDVIHIQHEYGIFGPKSVTSWVFFPLLFLFTSLKQTPVVVTMHSAWNSETVGPSFTTLKKFYVKLNNAMLASGTDHFLFLSQNCKDRFLDSVETDSYTVLPHGVQTETVEMSDAEAKRQFGYDTSETVIVEPGYVRPEKGQDVFAEVAKELPEYEFLIAGGIQADEDSAFIKEVEQTAPQNVSITGMLDDSKFHAAFNAADLVLLPYREVTQSGILNWCSAYLLPVAGSESEYFEQLEEAWGCVAVVGGVNSIDPDQLTELLEHEDKRQKLVSGMEAYQKAHSMTAVADEHYNVYDKMLN